MPLDPVELPRCGRVVLGVLPSDRKTHSMPLPHVTADHTLMRDVLPHLPLQVRFDLDIPELVTSSSWAVLH